VTRNDGIETPYIETIDLAQAPEPDPIRDAHSVLRLNLPNSPPPLNPTGTVLAQASAQFVRAPTTVIETDFDLQTRASEHDTPFRPPSLLRTTCDDANANADISRTSSVSTLMWSERSTAAFLGFAAGMLIIVPAVFYLSLETSQQPAPEHSASPPKTATASLSQDRSAPEFKTANITDGRWINQTLSGLVRTKGNAGDQAVRADVQATEQKAAAIAKHLIADGRLSDARATLRQAASPETAKLWFLLAETYDPNINRAAPDAENLLTLADTKFARFYYNQALTHGVTSAQSRLSALAAQ